MIGSEENHGKGYGTEALELFCSFAFNELRLNRVELVCWEFNTKARRVYEKVGFVQGVRGARSASGTVPITMKSATDYSRKNGRAASTNRRSKGVVLWISTSFWKT